MSEDDKKTMNGFVKVLKIIASPQEALRAIKEKPNILIPLVIIIILPMIYYIAFWSTLEPKLIMETENQMLQYGIEPTREMMDAQMKVMRYVYPFQGVLSALFAGLIGGTYYFICAKIAKSEVRFKQIMSLVYHVAIIGSLAVILNMILTIAGMDVSPTVPMTSLASLMPESLGGSFLYGATMTIEVFGIWGSVVTYFGLRIIADMSKKASLITILLGYVLAMGYIGGSMILSQWASTLG